MKQLMEKSEKLTLGQRLARRYHSDMPMPMQKGKFLFCFLACLPAVFGFIMWYLLVNFNSILMAFQDPITKELSMVNFERLLNELTNPTTEIYRGLVNTFKWFFLSAFVLPSVGYFIAYFLYRRIKFAKFWLIMIHLPGIISAVVISSMMKNAVSPLGPISYIMNSLGLGYLPNLFADPKTATPAMMAIVFFTSLQVNVLLMIGTFKRLPESLMDAAKIDGATETQQLFLIVTPLVSSTLVTLVILSFTGIFAASGPILYYTQGGADTMTLSYWIFAQTYNGGLLNYPAAVGIFFSAIGIPLVLITRALANKIAKFVEY